MKDGKNSFADDMEYVDLQHTSLCLCGVTRLISCFQDQVEEKSNGFVFNTEILSVRRREKFPR